MPATPIPFRLPYRGGHVRVVLEVGRYPYGGGTFVALNLAPASGLPAIGPDAERLAVLTDNITGVTETLPFGEFTRKLEDGEYDALCAALEEHGYIERTARSLVLEFNYDRADGQTRFPIYRLTERAREVGLFDERWAGRPAAPAKPLPDRPFVMVLRAPHAQLINEETPA